MSCRYMFSAKFSLNWISRTELNLLWLHEQLICSYSKAPAMVRHVDNIYVYVASVSINYL